MQSRNSLNWDLVRTRIEQHTLKMRDENNKPLLIKVLFIAPSQSKNIAFSVYLFSISQINY